MSTTIKFKSIWYSFFQAQNSMLIQKSIKHVDKFDDKKTSKDGSTSTTAAVASATTSRTASTSSGTSTPINDDYRLKREKNNESVRKSRAKSRMKLQECAGRVQELRSENTELNNKLNNLQTELFTLRGLFQTCFSLNNNKNQVKPNEIPTSTLYKLVMQNQHKLGLPDAPKTPAITAAAAITTTIPQMVESTPQMLPITDGTNNALQLQQQQPELPAKQASDEEFYINELKNALINCVSYPDSPVTPTSTTMDQQLHMSNSNQMLAISELENSPADMIQSFLNEFEIDGSSASPYSTNNDPLLSSPTTTDSDLFQENLAMIDHDYTYRRAEFMN